MTVAGRSPDLKASSAASISADDNRYGDGIAVAAAPAGAWQPEQLAAPGGGSGAASRRRERVATAQRRRRASQPPAGNRVRRHADQALDRS